MGVIKLKIDPEKLPVPPLPPTKAVNIGFDKMSYIPSAEPKPKPKPKEHCKEWAEKDERILIKLKSSGMKNVDIAKRMGRSYEAIKTKLKLLKRQGRLQ